MHKSLDMGKIVHVELEISDKLSLSSLLHYFLSGLSLLLGGFGGIVIVAILLLPALATIILICEATRCFYCTFF